MQAIRGFRGPRKTTRITLLCLPEVVIRGSSAEQTLKKVRACGCCRFISLKAGLSTLWARNFRALATVFLLERLEGAFLGFASCSHKLGSKVVCTSA